MEVKRDEYWIAKIQMFPGDRLMNRIVWIYRVEKSGDIGFMLIGDEDVYWRCGAQIDGFVVSPRFCPYCGKEF